MTNPSQVHPDPTREDINREINHVTSIILLIEELESFKFDNAPYSHFGDMMQPMQDYLDALDESLEEGSETVVRTSRA